MFAFKQYIVTVTTAAIIGCIAISICEKKTSTSAVIKLIVGIFMTLTVLKPIVEIEIADISDYLSNVHSSASDSVQTGCAWADSETVAIIKEQLEAYIQDKASAVGAHIDVDVDVCGQAPYIPSSVTLSGNASPYAKTQLSIIIEKDIGVSKENQIWTE